MSKQPASILASRLASEPNKNEPNGSSYNHLSVAVEDCGHVTLHI
jgi:hypothetical protein